MRRILKSVLTVILSLCMVISGIHFEKNSIKAEALDNVANGRNSTCYLTSNANNGTEGFLYVGNGFSAINVCNENLGNGNNLLGRSATTDEAAVYVDLGNSYDIRSAKVYQGSTNSNYPDSYCKEYRIYYSEMEVNKENRGNIEWVLAGTCDNGTIYNGNSIVVRNAENRSDTGDTIEFAEVCKKARSVKVVFDKEKCMGTGVVEGTVSLVSLQIYGENSNIEEDKTTTEGEEMTDILFIGNSMTYYNTLCNVVEGLATYYGHNVKCTAATNGGKNLIYNSTADNVVSAIKKGGHDIVVLQDIVGSFDGDKLLTGVEACKALIEKYNPGAKIVLYMPWPVTGKLTGEQTLEPYFAYSYVKAARIYGATLAPAGEAFYDAYMNGYNYYCDDEKHPMPLGTFISATSVFYTLYPEEEQKIFDESDQIYLSNLINKNIAYANASAQTYDLQQLNFISEKSYYYSHAVADSVSDTTGKTKYVSTAGEYYNADDEIDISEAIITSGETVTSDLFLKDNIAHGCDAAASSDAKGKATNVTDGNLNTRWESDYADLQWLYVDLGSVTSFNKVGFIWEGAYAAKYYIQLSDNAEEWKTVAVVNADSKKTVQIDLGKTYEARYVRMYGTKRATGYGYSFYEMGIWCTEESDIKTSEQVKIEGYQIGYIAKGSRVIGSVEPVINGKKVEKWGLVYSIIENDGTQFDVSENDMYVGSDNMYVASEESTSLGTSDVIMGTSDTAVYFKMTTLFSSNTVNEFTAKYKVRAYALLEDGTYLYSDVCSYSVYYIADLLYKNKLMNTLTSHEYLYTDILKVVNKDYASVDYDWGNTMVK